MNPQLLPGGCAEVLGSSRPHLPEKEQLCHPAYSNIHTTDGAEHRGVTSGFIHCLLSMVSTVPTYSQ